jgi:hypothetical protein
MRSANSIAAADAVHGVFIPRANGVRFGTSSSSTTMSRWGHTFYEDPSAPLAITAHFEAAAQMLASGVVDYLHTGTPIWFASHGAKLHNGTRLWLKGEAADGAVPEDCSRFPRVTPWRRAAGGADRAHPRSISRAGVGNPLLHPSIVFNPARPHPLSQSEMAPLILAGLPF